MEGKEAWRWELLDSPVACAHVKRGGQPSRALSMLDLFLPLAASSNTKTSPQPTVHSPNLWSDLNHKHPEGAQPNPSTSHPTRRAIGQKRRPIRTKDHVVRPSARFPACSGRAVPEQRALDRISPSLRSFKCGSGICCSTLFPGCPSLHQCFLWLRLERARMGSSRILVSWGSPRTRDAWLRILWRELDGHGWELRGWVFDFALSSMTSSNKPSHSPTTPTARLPAWK